MRDTELKLLNAFPQSFINHLGEFIAHRKSNIYFNLANCVDDLEIKCKVLEWLSRSACKTQVYRQHKKNDEFHEFMLRGINTFLGTDFSKKDIALIYQELGNQVNRPLTVKFVESGYNMELLKSCKQRLYYEKYRYE